VGVEIAVKFLLVLVLQIHLCSCHILPCSFHTKIRCVYCILVTERWYNIFVTLLHLFRSVMIKIIQANFHLGSRVDILEFYAFHILEVTCGLA
jgi:hypothetical protein